MNFELKLIICSHLLVGFEINAHATRSLGPSKAQGRQGKILYGWHKRCSYVRLATRKVRGDTREIGFWLGCGGSGIVCTKFERKDQHDNQIKSKQLSPPIRRQKRNSSTQDSFHSFIDTKIGYHFSDYKKHINSCHESQ